MRQHLLQSLPMDSILTASGPFTQLARQNTPANFTPKFHVGDHPCHLPPPDHPVTRHHDEFPDIYQIQQLNI